MRDHDLTNLIAATDGPLDETRAAIAAVGAATAAQLLLAEVVSRAAALPPPPVAVDVQLVLTSEAKEHSFVLTVGPDGARAERARLEAPLVEIRQELAELVRTVYGPEAAASDATRAMRIMSEPGPASDDPADPWLAERRAATLAAGQVIGACSPRGADLAALARLFGSDKWGDNLYTDHYERHLAPYRDRRVRLLEIGIGGFEDPHGGGESLRMWRHYLRRGLIYGLDLYEKSLDEPRVLTVRGDQSDAAAMARLADTIGPLDVVIDDGSHLSAHVIASFTALFPRLAPGGLYVIEDLQTSYWSGWNGDRAPDDPATTIGYLKTLADGLHHQDQPERAGREPSEIELSVRAIHLYHNIAFIEKGLNAEPTAPSWVRREVSDMDLEPKGSMRRR